MWKTKLCQTRPDKTRPDQTRPDPKLRIRIRKDFKIDGWMDGWMGETLLSSFPFLPLRIPAQESSKSSPKAILPFPHHLRCSTPRRHATPRHPMSCHAMPCLPPTPSHAAPSKVTTHHPPPSLSPPTPHSHSHLPSPIPSPCPTPPRNSPSPSARSPPTSHPDSS